MEVPKNLPKFTKPRHGFYYACAIREHMVRFVRIALLADGDRRAGQTLCLLEDLLTLC